LAWLIINNKNFFSAHIRNSSRQSAVVITISETVPIIQP
jgi:hypothetical protein